MELTDEVNVVLPHLEEGEGEDQKVVYNEGDSDIPEHDTTLLSGRF